MGMSKPPHRTGSCSLDKLLHMGGQINLSNGPQLRFDGWTLWFQERRKREPLSKSCNIFVDREAWPIGSQFTQHPAWLTEVDRAEVEPVDHRSHSRVDPDDSIPPLSVLLFVWSTECHVVNAAYTDETGER